MNIEHKSKLVERNIWFHAFASIFYMYVYDDEWWYLTNGNKCTRRLETWLKIRRKNLCSCWRYSWTAPLTSPFFEKIDKTSYEKQQQMNFTIVKIMKCELYFIIYISDIMTRLVIIVDKVAETSKHLIVLNNEHGLFVFSTLLTQRCTCEQEMYKWTRDV